MPVIYVTGKRRKSHKKYLAARNKATPKRDQYHDIHYNTVIKSTLAIRSRTFKRSSQWCNGAELTKRCISKCSFSKLLFFLINAKSPNYVKMYYAVCLFYEIIMESEALRDYVFGRQTMYVYVTR